MPHIAVYLLLGIVRIRWVIEQPQQSPIFMERTQERLA